MMKKFKKINKKIVALIAAVSMVAVSVPNFFEKMTVEASASAVNFNEDNIAMSFAVLSDLHLHKSGNATAANVQAQVQRYANAVATLNQMAVNNGNGLDMLLLAGDYGDTATEAEGRAFASATEQILEQLEFVNNKDAGVIFAYGNHETQVSESVTNAMTYEQWEAVLGEYGLAATAKDANDAYVPWGCNHETVVKTVGGEEKTYHFFSLEIYSYASNFIRVDALEWLDAELEAATTADPDAYVYLACHAPTRESGVYGADENFDPFFWWGSTRDDYRTTTSDGVALSGGLHSVLEKYPQVVHFSGHYHYTNLLESTIMSNGYYTTVAMAALSDSAIANSASQDNGYQDNVSAYNQTQVDKGYGLLVEVDKDGNQRMTRLEIDKYCSNMVVAEITYQANDAGTTIAEDKYTENVAFTVDNNVQPTTLTPWVMNAPTEDKSHLDTYSQATRKGTPVFPEGAKLSLENMIINEDGSVNFDITYDTVGAKTADTNWVIRYELELYNQDGELLNAGKTVRRLKDDRTAFYTVRKDTIWMLGNFAATTDGVVEGTNHLDATKLSYSYSLSADDLSGVTGIYAKLYAVDEFGGKSAPLTYGSKTQLVNVGPIVQNGGFETGNLTNWFDETSATPVKQPKKVTVNYSFGSTFSELYFTFSSEGDLSSLTNQTVNLCKNSSSDAGWTLTYISGYLLFVKQYTPAENDIIQIPKGLQITCNGETYEIAEDFAVKFNGSNWAKCDATPTEQVVGPIAAVTDETRSGDYSLKIEREDTTKKFVRTDINSISPETEYKLTYYINTAVYAAVEATIYEYSFNNKIVGKHQVEVYGATSDWKKGELTFTTSAGADKLGLILTAKGSAGVIYVDDVAIEAQEAEKIQFSYDDSNGDGDFNIKDIVRMKSALTNGKGKLATPKYADRNGDGTFDGGDTAALRAKAAGVADDFTNVLVTGGDIEAFGAKLQSDSGNAFMATGKNYSNQTFTFTSEYQGDGKMFIGVRMPEPTNSRTDATGKGIIVGLYAKAGFVEFYDGAKGPAIGATFLNLIPGEKYVFSVWMTNNEDGTATLYLEARQDSVLKSSLKQTFDADVVANYIPAEGQFAVWAQEKCQEMLYQVVDAENPTKVIVDGEQGYDGVVTLNKDAASGTGYLVLDGNYTTEEFRVTTTLDASSGKDLYIGAHLTGNSGNPTGNCGIIFDITESEWWVSCVNSEKHSNSQYSKAQSTGKWTLATGVEYTFVIQVDLANGTGSLKVLQGETVVQNKTGIFWESNYNECKGHYSTCGDFMVWSAVDSKKIAWDMPEKDLSFVEIDADTAAGSALLASNKPGDLTNSAYLVTKKTYTTEAMEFTTTLDKIDNIVLGTRMSGKAHNPATHSGLYIQFTEDGTGYSVYNKGTAVATGTFATALVAGTEYTFRLSINGTKLRFDVEKDGTNVHYATLDVSSTTVPSAGYFMVWSLDAYHIIDYSQIIEGGHIKTVASDGKAGTYVLSSVKSGDAPYLVMDGQYTTEVFKFTTMFESEFKVGLHMTENDGYWPGGPGIVLNIGASSYALYCANTVTEPTHNYGYSTQAVGNYTNALVAGQTYTFEVSYDYDANKLKLVIRQGETVINTVNGSLWYYNDHKAHIPAAGDFMVWGDAEGKKISYEIPVKKPSQTVTTGASGTVTLYDDPYTSDSIYPYLTVDGNYTTETFSVTTTLDESAGNDLFLGAHMTGNSGNWQANPGIVFDIRENGWTVYCLDSAKHAVNSQFYRAQSTGSWTLETDVEYTFVIQMDTTAGTGSLKVMQGDKVVQNKTGIFWNLSGDTGCASHISTTGDFMVWSAIKERTISYEVK